ncbi:hypothetical protein [Sodalis praecaptivus]|uniref:hypothetical protein n=1 Tax=Sodalis praecaptivus TaxID=1239307 RepID=UPI0035E3C603
MKNSARRNDDFSIDYLFTLACENIDAGQEAASFLFDLFTGKEAGHPDLPEQLGRDSLKFFDIVNDRNKEKLPSEAWKVPDKVLIMAGYTCQRDTQQYQDILASIDNNALINCCTYGNEHRSFFDSNRLISSSEIQSATSKLNGNNAGLTFSDTTAISAEDITTKNIPQNLLSTLLNIDENGNQTPSVGHFIPLLIRDHWVLFGLSTSNAGQTTAVMFDSQDSLKPEEVDFWRTLADFAGAEHFLPVSAPLQHHAPNARAVFVCHAMLSIAKDPTAPADETLQAFVESFLALTDEEQARFNKHARAELYGNVLDTLSLDRGVRLEP